VNVVAGQGGLASPTTRYEELLAQREELEALKRENENLRRTIKELEVARRNSGVSMAGSETGTERAASSGGRT
jgi:cell division protein FtsB